MDDDFGTPQAVSLLFDLVSEGNRLLDEPAAMPAYRWAVEEIVEVLGLDDASSAPCRDLVGPGRFAARFGVEGDAHEVVRSLVELRATRPGSSGDSRMPMPFGMVWKRPG